MKNEELGLRSDCYFAPHFEFCIVNYEFHHVHDNGNDDGYGD